MSHARGLARDARLVERVQGEYQEMPGLALTIEQACRLWGCDEPAARRVAAVFVEAGVLRWTHDGRWIRV